jgi:nicotinate-nucleotide adenylyltransferase
MSLDLYISTCLEETKAKELVFFGGSFNPWHKGHSSCLELIARDKTVIVIPDHSPFKELTPMGEKLSQLEDIEKEIKKANSSAYLFDGFLKENKQNPTFKWLSTLGDNFPTIKLSLLMGFDTFISLDKWHHANELLNLLDSIYIASRLDDTEIKEKQINILKKIAPNLKIQFLGRHDFEDQSSTEMRKL